MKTVKRIAIVLGLLLLGGAGWFIAFEPAYFSQLAMPLKVHIDRPAGATPIKAVWMRSGFRRDTEVEKMLAKLDKAPKWVEDHQLWPSESFDGIAVDFRVNGDDYGSRIGITLTYAQDNKLLVVAELTDGRWVGAVADIPDARAIKEMRVALP